MAYHRILLAVDLGPESRYLCQKALGLASGAQIRLVHVVEPVMVLPPYELPSMLPEGLELQLVEQARNRLNELAREFQISEWDMVVEIGATKSVLLEQAENFQADLILLGSHGRHGVSRILGSTANAIIHHAKCDVLAVRIHN